MVSGINHITLAVSDLERSFAFYTNLVGLKPVAKWASGAYLLAGNDWICLSVDAKTRRGPQPEYTHLALSVESAAFDHSVETICSGNVTIWKENKSEGDSFYFLDPDGHKLEIHAGDLQSRLAALKEKPYEDFELYI